MDHDNRELLKKILLHDASRHHMPVWARAKLSCVSKGFRSHYKGTTLRSRVRLLQRRARQTLLMARLLLQVLNDALEGLSDWNERYGEDSQLEASDLHEVYNQAVSEAAQMPETELRERMPADEDEYNWSSMFWTYPVDGEYPALPWWALFVLYVEQALYLTLYDDY